MSHFCPVCRQVKIHRREVRTCGSPECISAWRQWTPPQKAKALEERDAEDLTVGPNELADWIGRKEGEGEGTIPTAIEEFLGVDVKK